MKMGISIFANHLMGTHYIFASDCSLSVISVFSVAKNIFGLNNA